MPCIGIRGLKSTSLQIFSPIRTQDQWNAVSAYWVIFLISGKKIKFLRSNSWSTIKITPKTNFDRPTTVFLFWPFLKICHFQKIKMTKFEEKMSFFISDSESEGQKLSACNFLARSEVKINTMSFWRFGWSSWYDKK